MDMKLEVVVVPVFDVDKAKDFCQALGWRLDTDFVTGADFRVVQLAPRLGLLGHLRHRAHLGRTGVGAGPAARVYVRNPDGSPVLDSVSVTVDITDVTFS